MKNQGELTKPLLALASNVQAAALWDSNQQPAYQACADEFSTRNPNITISIEQAGWSEYWDGLTTSLVANYS
jgi:ABC-type glycerol-3-phosphate transport system substrate-binding protein